MTAAVFTANCWCGHPVDLHGPEVPGCVRCPCRNPVPVSDVNDGVYPAGAKVSSEARISRDLTYRYSMSRRWGDGPVLGWIMLNPSVADQRRDDPTIRRCVGFARRYGFNAIEVVNLYAYRATDPAEMFAAADAGIDVVGPGNDDVLAAALADPDACFIAGWGAKVDEARVEEVLALPGMDRLLHVGPLTKSGQPRHPLMLSYASGLYPLRWSSRSLDAIW